MIVARGHGPLSRDAGLGGWVPQHGAGGGWCWKTFLERVPTGHCGRQGSPSRLWPAPPLLTRLGTSPLLLPSVGKLPSLKVLGEVASPSQQLQSCPMHPLWLGMLMSCWSEECCRTIVGPEN